MTLATSILRKALVVSAALAGLIVVIGVALTSTEVGRDALRREAERQFERAFEGRIEIGMLSGNLLRRVRGSDVRLYDDDDRLVLSVDSLTYRPFWRDVLDRTLTSGRIELFRPHLHVTFDSLGPNLASIFRRDGAGGDAEWAFRAADIRIIDGRVSSSSAGYASEAVERGIIFDFTRSEVERVNARLRVDVRRDDVLVSVRRLTMTGIAPATGTTTASGRLVLRERQLSIENLRLATGDADLRATIRYAFDPGAAPELSVDLDETLIQSALARALVPRFPLSDDARVAMRLTGRLDSLVVDHVSVAREASILRLSGTVAGLPHRADYRLAIDEGRIAHSDLAALEPRLAGDARLSRLGTLKAGGTVYGAAEPGTSGDWRLQRLAGDVVLQSNAGSVQGPFELTASGGGYGLETRLRLSAVLPELLAVELAGSRISGRMDVRLAGPSMDSLSGAVRVNLGASLLAGRSVDSLGADIIVHPGVFQGRSVLIAGSGFASFDGELSYGDDGRGIEGAVALRSFDLGPWLGDEHAATWLNADVDVSGLAHRDNHRLRLAARFDSSAVIHRQERVGVPPHVMHAALTSSPAGLEASVWGDVFDLEIRSVSGFEALAAGLADWRPRITDAVETEASKLRRTATNRNGIGDAAPSEPRTVVDGRNFQLHAAGSLHRPEWAATLLPALRDLQTDLRFELALDGTADSLHARLDLQADSLRLNRFGGAGIDIASEVRVSSSDAWPHGVAATAYVRASEVVTPTERFRDPIVALSLEDARGAVHIESGGSDDDERMRITARLGIGAMYNRLLVDDVTITARGAVWSLTSTQTLLQYADALVVPALELTSHASRTQTLQRIRLEGTLSAERADTLYAVLDEVSLRELSEMMSMRDPLDGVINGRIAFTGFVARPEITGDLDVDRIVFDGRPVGRLTVASTYVPGEPDIALDARISPIGADEGARPEAGIPAGATTNDLRLHGRFRLPVPGADRRLVDPGMLDLALRARSVDPFFFEYIFREKIAGVGGVLQGSGSIGGDFRRPVFGAQVTLRDGRVRIPHFNLAYRVDGDATVDRDGIRLHGVRVSDATGGRAVVDGGILFNEYRYFSFDLRGRLDNTQFMNVLGARDLAFYGDVRGSGTVTLTGPLHQALLQTNDATISTESRVFIAIQDESASSDPGFIIFADADGSVPDIATVSKRETLLSRPVGERPFVDGLEMDLNFAASQGVTVHLVIDPLLGDVINATGSGRIQLQRLEGDYYTFGTFNVSSGDYLFTAGDVFVRRFLLDGGSITWDGPPNNASMDIRASYRTRASPAGLNLPMSNRARIPLIVHLHITERVAAPMVDLRLSVDRTDRDLITSHESIEALLNQPERSAEYATSVLLTNSFLLTTSLGTPGEGSITTTRNQLAFTSLSQLVSSQLNRYLNHALPNVDVNVGFLGESAQDLDVSYGVALSLLDERLVIRGQGLYQNEATQEAQQNLLDEFVVELRVSNSVSVEVFYRREGDILGADQTLANTTGAGLSYETQFSTWSRLMNRLFGWMRRPDDDAAEEDILAVEIRPASAD